MLSARTPDNESERQANLDLYEILDTFPEEAFDAITSIAAHNMWNSHCPYFINL